MQLACSLQRCYVRGRRDVKLENIFIAEDGRVRLGDFGLTMSMKQELAISPVGTVEYMAPEVWRCASLECTSIVSSLFTGRPDLQNQLCQTANLQDYINNKPFPHTVGLRFPRRLSGWQRSRCG